MRARGARDRAPRREGTAGCARQPGRPPNRYRPLAAATTELVFLDATGITSTLLNEAS